MTQNPIPISKGTATSSFMLRYFLAFSSPLSRRVWGFFFVYYLAAASISNKIFFGHASSVPKKVYVC